MAQRRRVTDRAVGLARKVVHAVGQRPSRARHELDGRREGEVHELRRRVKKLEAEVQECRRLNRRVAELTDLVAEVLLPATQRDEVEFRRRLDELAEGRR